MCFLISFCTVESRVMNSTVSNSKRPQTYERQFTFFHVVMLTKTKAKQPSQQNKKRKKRKEKHLNSNIETKELVKKLNSTRPEVRPT